jgi:hypothetical protein
MPRQKKTKLIDGGLSKVKAHPLSDGEIRKVLGNNISIMTNRELEENVTDIMDCFDDEGRFIMLYTPNDPTSGHWVCLILTRTHGQSGEPMRIHYFDPYGEQPDTAADLGDQPPILTELLELSKLPVYYNTHQYQTERSDVATCGRWVITRLIYKDLDEDEFYDVVKKYKGPPDDFVVGLTYGALKK